MAPIYEHECRKCEEVHEVHRPINSSGTPYRCPSCNGVTNRLYSAPTVKAFQSYESETLGNTHVTSLRQERALQKKYGRVPLQETPTWDKFKTQRREYKKKPIYSTSVGTRGLGRYDR